MNRSIYRKFSYFGSKSHRCRVSITPIFGVGRWLEMLALQISQCAPQLAVADLVATGKQCLERCQECRFFVRLQRTGCVDNGERLRVSENHGRCEFFLN